LKEQTGALSPGSPISETVFKRIFALDKKIRYCGVIDGKGVLISGTMRKNLKSLEPESEDTQLFLHIALAVSMDKSWDKYFGRTRSITIMKEKLSLYIYSLADSRAVIIATEPTLPMAKSAKLGEIVDTADFGISDNFQ
jgi:hypothetical protein